MFRSTRPSHASFLHPSILSALIVLCMLAAGLLGPVATHAAARHAPATAATAVAASDPIFGFTCLSSPSDFTCDGADVAASGCAADAITLASTPITTAAGLQLGYVAVRYSPTCKSAWAHTVSGIGSAALDAKIRRADGVVYERSGSGTGVRSPLVYVGYQAVCARGSINGTTAATAPICP